MFRRLRDELVHTVAHGDGATTIVGLAGVFGNVELWQQPFEILHQRHRTIAFDHFGTGETRFPPERVNFEEQVSLVADVLDSFEVAEQVRDAELVVIDDAGHVPTLSRPEAVATAMDRFADRINHH